MRYVLLEGPGGWRVEHIEFAAPPKVGRKAAPLGSDAAHAQKPSLSGAVDGGAP